MVDNKKQELIAGDAGLVEKCYYGCGAIRALLLINGGAVVAVLAFLGDLISKQPAFQYDLSSTFISLLIFALGVFFATGVLAYMCFSQNNGCCKKWARRLTILSCICFVLGALFAINGLYNINGKHTYNKTSKSEAVEMLEHSSTVIDSSVGAAPQSNLLSNYR